MIVPFRRGLVVLHSPNESSAWSLHRSINPALLNFRLLFLPPLQGDVGHPGEPGDPGSEGEKVHLLLSFSLLKLVRVKVSCVHISNEEDDCVALTLNDVSRF